MATLIDRDKCQERIFRFADRLVDWGYPEQAKAVRAVAKGIKLEKTVDAVEVVRCKNCTSYQETVGKDSGKPCGYGSCINTCAIITGIVYDEDFCSYGERRTEG